MPSRVLYPPTIDSYLPAFQAGPASKCRVYFSLSKFNSISDFSSIHVSVVKQNSGINVVNTKDDVASSRYRATGIILNVKPSTVEGKDNLYYFDILNSDLMSKDNNIGTGYEGWIPGWIYKIQIRLSQKDYSPADGGQAAWINSNSFYFSEWSTVCVTKAIGRMDLIVPPLDFDSTDENNPTSEEKVKTLYISTLDFFGKIISEDTSEVLYQYRLKIYDINDDKLLEDSGDIFASQYQDTNEFRYIGKYEFKNGTRYKLAFSYITNNGFSFTYKTNFEISLVQIDQIDCYAITVDNDIEGILKGLTSKELEEEEGRIGIKLNSINTNPYSGNICIRRASSKDQFKEWVDIKIITVREQIVNNLPLFYDYTIESGVWYKYGVQSINKRGERGILNQSSPLMRNFEYSYLLGENNQQLKLMFNNTMGNYKIQLMESKNETIGGIYPIITRNSALKYKIFPINGLISFWMDENNLFCNKKVIYGNQEIADLYKQTFNPKYSTDGEHQHNEIYTEDTPGWDNHEVSPKYIVSGQTLAQDQYDYIYERDFRQLVLDFLHDGKPKLFKSPTEGNVIVRLTDINCTPNQSLDRMIYEFSSTGNELAENNYNNYLKYKFLVPGTWSSEYSVYETKLGQLQMTFTPDINIFNEIYKKYDSRGENLGGYTKTLRGIHHIKITIEDKPLRVRNSAGELVVGNNFRISGVPNVVTIYDPRGIYEFDNRLTYTKNDELYLLSCAEYEEETDLIKKQKKLIPVKATIDFLYDLQSEVYEAKQIQTRQVKLVIGQIFNEYRNKSQEDGVSIYTDIFRKYFIDWDDSFRKLNSISSIEIEANPYTVFLIQDSSEIKPEQHEINDTGNLKLYELNNIQEIRYLGVRDKNTGEIDYTQPANVLVNYICLIEKGTYKVEGE